MKIILILLLISSLYSCTRQDYGYLNTDRRNCKSFVRVSKRFTWSWDSITVIKSNPEIACDSAIIWLQNYRDTSYWSPLVALIQMNQCQNLGLR